MADGEKPKKDLASALKEVKGHLKTLSTKDTTTKQRLDALNKVVHLSGHAKEIVKKLGLSAVLTPVRTYLTNQQRSLRTASLRVIRYFIVDTAALKEVVKAGIPYFVARSLERTGDSQQERTQALKLISRMMEVDTALLPRSIATTLIAIADDKDDDFRQICLQSLIEITIRNTELIAHANGMKTIMNAMLEPSLTKMADALTLTLLFLLNEADTRAYVRSPLDIVSVMAPFTAFNTEPKALQASKGAIITMLKSWVGVISLAGSPAGLTSLVSALKLPGKEVKIATLSILYDTFRLRDPFSKSNRQSTSGFIDPLASGSSPIYSARARPGTHNLLNNYFSAVLMAFVQAGLLEVLVEIGTHFDGTVARSSVILLGELLALANRVLPPALCTDLQTLPTLVHAAASLKENPTVRARASQMLNDLRELSTSRSMSDDTSGLAALAGGHTGLGARTAGSALVRAAAGGARRSGLTTKKAYRIEALKVQIDKLMDNSDFDAHLKDSKVLSTSKGEKDYQKWNWGTINELLEGPLQTHARLEVCMTRNKFMKRLIAFYLPSKGLFSTQARSGNQLYVHTGATMLSLLLSSESGMEYLNASGFVTELTAQLKKEVSVKFDESEEGRVFGPKQVTNTNSREYFSLLGVLSGHPRGLDLLVRHDTFSHLFQLVERADRDDLARMIVASLDYSPTDGLARMLLGKGMASGSRAVRLHATRHMRTLLRAGVSSFEGWGTEALVAQLYDSDEEVASEALRVLDEACDNETNLRAIIKRRPDLSKRGPPGKSLMIRFLSLPIGYEYLKEVGFVASELTSWRAAGFTDYVNVVENALTKALSLDLSSPEAREMYPFETGPLPVSCDVSGSMVSLPHHFYGELAKTKAGCDALRASGHYEEFEKIIYAERGSKPLERRAALWAVGHIGSHDIGFMTFVAKTPILQAIVTLAHTSVVFSLRGTCYYVLGLISRTAAGRSALEEFGWESPPDHSATVSVPLDVKSFFQIPTQSFTGSWANESPVNLLGSDADFGKSDPRKEVVTALLDLCNHITQDAASSKLVALRSAHPKIFREPTMLFVAYKIMDQYSFRLELRRKVMAPLFDVTLVDAPSLSKYQFPVPVPPKPNPSKIALVSLRPPAPMKPPKTPSPSKAASASKTPSSNEKRGSSKTSRGSSKGSHRSSASRGSSKGSSRKKAPSKSPVDNEKLPPPTSPMTSMKKSASINKALDKLGIREKKP